MGVGRGTRTLKTKIKLGDENFLNYDKIGGRELFKTKIKLGGRELLKTKIKLRDENF